MNQKQLTAPDSRACRIKRPHQQNDRTRRTPFHLQRDLPAATKLDLRRHLTLGPAPTAEKSSQYSTVPTPPHLQKEGGFELIVHQLRTFQSALALAAALGRALVLPSLRFHTAQKHVYEYLPYGALFEIDELRKVHPVVDLADVLAAEQRAKDAENALTEARQEIASLTAERARDSGAHLSKDASSLSRRLAETEALLLKKNEQIDSLTRRFTDLAWRSTIEKRGALNASSSPTDGASVSASAVSGADGLTPLAYRRPLNRRLETVLRHRRFIIGTYLAFLHLLAYEYLFA